MGSLRSALADDLVWDFDAVILGAQDGAGTWTLGQANWFNQTQALNNQVWMDGHNAIFGVGTGAAGTVTLGGPVTVGDLTFNAAGSGSYTIVGGGLTLANSVVTANVAATISAVLAGGTDWTKAGPGQLTLDGGDSNTISGVVTVSSGRLHLAKAGGATAVAGDLLLNGGNLTFGGGAQISATSAVSLTSASSVFNGSGVNAGAFAAVQTLASFTAAGGAFNAGFGGEWTITGALSFTGGTSASSYVGNSSSLLSAGSLSLVGMNKTSAPSLSVADNSFTLYGNNAGTQTTVTVGVGGLYLENSNIHLKRGSVTGAKGSRLVLNGAVSTGGSAGSLIRLDGGELQGEAIIELSGTAGAVNRTFTIAGGGADLEISVVVTDGASAAAGIIKDGAGILTLSAANTYTGGTILQDGTVRAGDVDALSTGDITFTGGTLQYTSATSGTDWATRFKNSTAAIGLDTNGQNVTLAGAIDNSNSGGFTKSGAGTLLLFAVNNYTGATTLAGGLLQAGDENSLGSGDLTFTGGTLQYTTAIVTTDWAARFKNSTAAISLDTNGENVTLAGAIDGTNTGGLDKSGSGTLTLSGSNAFTGVSTISAGTLRIGNLSALAGSTLAGGAGTLSFGSLTAATFGGLSGSTALTLENDSSEAVTLTIGGNNTDTSYAGVLSGAGSLVKSGSGIFTLSGGVANTNTGSISATAGRLILSKTAGVDAIAGVLNISGGAKVTFAANNQIADTSVVTMSGVNSVFNGTGPNAGTLANINETFAELRITGGTFNSSAGSNWNIGAVTFDTGENKVFVGNSSSKQTFGSLRLVGMNGTSSSTAVTNGFTIFGNGGSFANRTLLTIGSGGLSLESSRIYLSGGTSGSELVLNGDIATNGSGASALERVAGGALPPFISLSGSAGTVARTFDIASGADLTVSPIITNGAATSASIIKSGAGVLILSGTEANTFTGGATVNAGTLRLSKTAGITAMNGDIVVNTGGTLQLSTSHQIADTAGITLNGGTMASWSTDETVAFFTQNGGGLTSGGNVGHVTITGALTLAGGNTLVINSNAGSANPASWDVGSAILSGADILVGGANGAGNPRTSLTIGAGGLTMLGRILTMNVGDAGAILNLNGDFTSLGNSSIITNSTASVQPLLEIGAASRIFNVLGGTTTIGVIISGSGGSLVKTGNGLLQLTTASTYSGITTASGGTLSVAGAGGMLTGTTAIIANKGAVFQNGSSTTPNNDGVSNRINPAATLTLGSTTGGGTFNLMSASTSAHTQDLQSLTISGAANAVNVIAAATTTSTLTFTSANPYVRTAGTVDFTQNPAVGGSIVFTNAPSGAGNVSNGLLVGATLNGTDLILAQSGVLTAFTGWIPTGTDTWTTSGAMDVTGTNAVAYAATNISALRFNAAGPFAVTLAGTHTVDSDVILMTPNAGAANSVVSGGVLQGTTGGALSVGQFNTAGTLEIASTIADNTSATGLAKSGEGVLILSGPNTYTGITTVGKGVLRAADGVGLPAGSALLLNGGAFDSSTATFSRSLGTAAGQVRLIGGTTGFSASGAASTVNLGGAGATVQWGTADFDPVALLLNASSATAALDFANGIDLNGSTRTIRVDANTATISSVISNSAAGSPAGFVKTGGGTLVLAQSNTFDGPATLSGGTLRLLQANAITGGVTATSGTLAVANDAALGAAVLTLSGGGLAADGAARTLANNIMVTSTGALTGSQTLTLNGVISGTGSLSKGSTSVVELAGDNTFTGTVTISGGILRVSSNTGLGAAGGNTTVTGSSHLELADGVIITGESITVSSTSGTTGDGSPTSNRGGLQAGVNATAEWAGNVILGVNQARIGVQEGGTLTVSGNITDGASSFDLRLSGELTGTGGLVLSGTGNAWDGQTEIVRGTVFLGAHNALPTSTTLDIHFTSSNNNEYAGLNMNGFNQTIGRLLNEGNTGNNAELTNSNRTLSTMTVNETGAATYNGIITGNLALVKTGAGTMTLARSHSFTGGITVNDGVLQIANSVALAQGNVTVNGGATTGGKLDLNNTSTTINSLNGAAGATSAIIANESATAGTRTLTVGVNHGSGAFAGNIVDNTVAASGLVALTKIGTGTQTLSGANSYTGTTTLSNGTVIAEFTSAAPLNATSPILLQGGELVISGATTATIGAVTLVQGGSDFTSNTLRIQDDATVTTSALIGQNFAPLLLDLTGGGTFIANSLTGITNTNGVLGQGSGQRASIYVLDDTGIGFATQNGGNEIVRYTGATTANATTSSSTTNFIIAADLTRTAELQYNTLQIDTTAGDVTLDVGAHNLTVGTFGRGVLISGANDSLITGTTGRFNGSSVFIANYSTGTTTVDVSLTGNAVVSTGPGLVVYSRTNNPNDLYVANGVFRVTGGDRDYTAGVLRIYGGGVLELGADINGAADGDFTRAAGLASGNVAMIGNGGFSAQGADRVVALGGVATPTALTWGASGFLSGPGGDNNYAFKIGSTHSTHTLEFQNSIDLGSRQRIVEVADGVDGTNVDGRLTGVLSGSGRLVKTGVGMLEISAANTYAGGTEVQAGALQIASTGSTGTGKVEVASGAAVLGTGVIQGSDVVLANGATLYAGDGMLASDHGTLNFTPATGGGVVSLQGAIMLDITSANNVDGTFGGNEVGSAGYISYVNAAARSLGLGSGSHDLLSFNAAGDSKIYALDFLTSGGTLQVRGSAGFAPEMGQVFNLLDWSGVTADFTGFDLGVNYRTGRDSDGNEGAFDLPDLFAAGLLWDLSQFTASGVIVVVPEPSRMLLLFTGFAMTILRRRRGLKDWR